MGPLRSQRTGIGLRAAVPEPGTKTADASAAATATSSSPASTVAAGAILALAAAAELAGRTSGALGAPFAAATPTRSDFACTLQADLPSAEVRVADLDGHLIFGNVPGRRRARLSSIQ